MSKKINILFTIPNFKTAGSQFVLLAIYERLDRSVFQPYVLVEKFPEIFPDEIEEEERLFLTETVGKRSYIGVLAGMLKQKEIQLVHSWDYKSNSLEALACRKANIPYLYTKKNNAWSKRWFAKSLLSKHIVYNNPEMNERFFDSALLKSKTTFIPHGIDVTLFTPLSHEDSQDFIIGCIGVIGTNKNQLFLLQALTKLPKHCKVLFYGKEDTDYKKVLLSFIEKHQLESQVEFKGYVANKDIPTIMRQFNVTVLASKNEGLPLSIIESMACGVPVLSSNSGGGARYLLEEDKGGYIFNLDKEDELVSVLLKLLNSEKLRKRLSEDGVLRVRENFSIEKEVGAYESLYKKLAR